MKSRGRRISVGQGQGQGFPLLEREWGRQMCSNKGPEWESPSLAGKECISQGQHAGPTCAWTYSLQQGCMGCFSSSALLGISCQRVQIRPKRCCCVSTPLLDQGLEQVLPERLPLHSLKASASMQSAQTLKGTWHDPSHSTQGKNSKVRVVGFFACFHIWQARGLSYIQGSTIVKL